MKEAGLIGSTVEPVKILGTGKIEKVLTVKAHKFSGSAKKLLETAGCSVVIASPKGAKQSKKEIASVASSRPFQGKGGASLPRNDAKK